jgi:shikimate kinase
LVGMMGAGKSTVARMVAAQLGVEAVDTDELVERSAATTVASIFRECGEDAFRVAESEAIQQLREVPGPIVVSVGGGAVLREENRRAMTAVGTVVWLRARPGTLAARLGRGQGRPLLAAAGDEGGLVKTLEKLMVERRSLYEQVADVVVDVDELSPRRVAQLVLAELERRSALGSGPL